MRTTLDGVGQRGASLIESKMEQISGVAAAPLKWRQVIPATARVSRIDDLMAGSGDAMTLAMRACSVSHPALSPIK